jgi:tetratricopeptide (TPR) repeat protein
MVRSCSWTQRLRLVCAIVVALAAGHAAADEPAARLGPARQLSDEGLAHFQERRYDEAIVAFQASYAIAPLPQLTFNLAQAFRLKGDCPRAAEHYRRYLREAPDAANRALVEQHLRALDRECGTPPVSKPVVAAPAAVPVAPAAKPPNPPTALPSVPTPLAPSHRPRLLESLGAAGFAVGVASLAAAVYFTVDGQHQTDLLGQSPDDPSRSRRQIDERGRTDNVLGGVFYAIGGAAVAGGAVLFGLGRRAERARPVAALPIAGGGMLVWMGRF